MVMAQLHACVVGELFLLSWAMEHHGGRGAAGGYFYVTRCAANRNRDFRALWWELFLTRNPLFDFN
jgi:hypothetical protein